ncbi:MAG: 4Fe-4S dicluster domain-containing protein [Firmicutes bacterium]|nr:4Fe-4S dicluster domain-containing protein [Bacillota bacterium]
MREGKSVKLSVEKLRSDYLKELTNISEQKPSECMQCAKCSAGCPVTRAMDLLPHQVLRYLQLGMYDKVFQSKTIWICASCFTCASRCPRDVDLTKLMEGLRVLALREKGGNKLRPEELPVDMLKEAPQQAFVSSFRKYSK